MTFRALDFEPTNLAPDVLHAIGLITACSAHTEAVINDAIAGCLGIDVEYGAAVSTHMSAPMRDDVLRAVAEIRMDNLDDLDRLDELLDEVRQAFRLRNGYVHGSLCRDKTTNEHFSSQYTARGSVDVDLVPLSIEKIRSDANRIYEAGIELFDFLNRRGLLGVVLDAPRPRGHKTKAA